MKGDGLGINKTTTAKRNGAHTTYMELKITNCYVCGKKLEYDVTARGDGDIPSVACPPCAEEQSNRM